MSDRKTLLMVVGGLTTVLLLLAVNPWFQLEKGTLRDVLTYGFWISFIVLLVMLFAERKQPGGETVEIEGPAVPGVCVARFRLGQAHRPG